MSTMDKPSATGPEAVEQPGLPGSVRTDAFIGGEFVSAASGRTFPTENPATGLALAQIAACDESDVDVAVKAARRAFEGGSWSRLAPVERKETLLRFVELLERDAEELALLDCLEAGKPISDCRGIDIPETLTTFQWFAEVVDKLYDHIAPTGPGAFGLILREPVGVVGAVLPWNFPALLFAWKAAPALAAGNSIVLKPAEQTSLSALRMAELLTEAGVPPGVVNVVPGFGETAGASVGRHEDVDVVSFTGSTEVGRLFLQYSAETNLKRIVLECGGKSPQIVMDDAADLDLVAEEVLSSAYWNMGENCSAGSRLLVHKDIQEPLLARLIDLSETWRVGDPRKPETTVGPLIEEAHLNKVLGYIDSGRRDGARVLVGGDRVLEESGGYFVAPTLFTGVKNEMAIAQEEIFGPVLATITFDTPDEAVAIANDTSYGLAASLWTTDLDTANGIGRALKAGTVSVNSYSEGDVSTPFGGYKQSGFGGRDKSMWAVDQYTELKTLWIARR